MIVLGNKRIHGVLTVRPAEMRCVTLRTLAENSAAPDPDNAGVGKSAGHIRAKLL